MVRFMFYFGNPCFFCVNCFCLFYFIFLGYLSCVVFILIFPYCLHRMSSSHTVCCIFPNYDDDNVLEEEENYAKEEKEGIEVEKRDERRREIVKKIGIIATF